VIGTCMPRRSAQAFRKFLDEVERDVPVGLDVRVVMDNASPHKTKLIRNWFARQPHWHRHFTPTSSSWINQVERFFALLAEKQIKRGTHKSVKQLTDAIEVFIRHQNDIPKPLRWTNRRRHSGVRRALLPTHPPRSRAKWTLAPVIAVGLSMVGGNSLLARRGGARRARPWI
jgi:transposase